MLLSLTPAGPGAWDLPITLELCSGRGALWGGCGLGAAVQAAEQTTGRPCRWASVQYLRPILPGQLVRLEVSSRDGRTLSQAQLTGTVDGVQVLAGLAALGGVGARDDQFVRAPDDVPPPEDCEPRPLPAGVDPAGTFLAQFEQRWAQAPRPQRTDGVRGTGRTRLWLRMHEPAPLDRVALAMLADLAPSALSEALGERARGVSLDNTVRYAREPDPHEGWVLLDLTVEAVVADVAQITGRLFDTDGALLAVAEQSAVVRPRPAPGEQAD
jgi:acyl-CoA thioesterase-2